MRVLLISTSYPSDSRDWRGVFIRHIVAALSRLDGVKLSVWAPPGDLPSNVEHATSPSESRWLRRLMRANGISHIMRSGGVKGILAMIQLLRMLGQCYRRTRDVDIYHINWLQCAIPLPDNKVPALITVLGNDLKLLRLPLMRPLMRRTMAKRKVILCPNAEWMHEPLARAFGDVANVVPVSFGIDPTWFAIQRSNTTEPQRWLAVTRLTADKLGPLFEWSEPLFAESQRELHLFGPMQEGVEVPPWVNYHGAATPEDLCNKWFPRATGLITLSRHAEGRPQVMLEAMAAGLPIIASDMPAHSSIVFHGKTGLLCDSFKTYQDALNTLGSPVTNLQYGNAAREWVRNEMGTWDACANRYREIYNTLLREDAGD